jgi:hypothetical protein
MSHSVPSDSSAIDATFLVGVDLVEFDRRELPIYASPQSRWMDACYDEAPSYGAPVDRVFGEPGDVHIDSVPSNDEQVASAIAPTIRWSPWRRSPTASPCRAARPPRRSSRPRSTSASTAHAVIHLHDGGWDITGIDGTFDYLA